MFKTWFVNTVNKYFVCKCYWVDFTALPGVIETLSNCGNLKVVLDCWYNSISLMFQNYFTLILHWGLFPLKIGRFIAYCNHSSLCYQRLASLLSAVMMIRKIWWCEWLIWGRLWNITGVSDDLVMISANMVKLMLRWNFKFISSSCVLLMKIMVDYEP